MIKNLMDKLQNKESGEPAGIAMQQVQAQAVPIVPTISKPIIPTAPQPPSVYDTFSHTQSQFQRLASTSRETKGGGETMQDFEEGIIIDLGEGISLNVPIQKRMSLGDFLKVAEKVKALEMLSEEVEYKKNF